MSIENGVSNELLACIHELMNQDSLRDFSLGGGTSLAIKYNHRVSTDIDLFSKGVLGLEIMLEIEKEIEEKFQPAYLKVLNKNQSNLCFIRSIIGKEETKVEIIQNLKNIGDPELINEIRLINDDDIGALKLLSAAGRGVQKDFYDLYLLTELKPLSHYYDHLLKYYELNKNTPSNIFDNLGSMGTGIGFDLKEDLSALCNFNNAGDKKNPSNRIEFTKGSTIKIAWPELRNLWKAKVSQLAKERNLKFVETPTQRKSKFPGRF